MGYSEPAWASQREGDLVGIPSSCFRANRHWLSLPGKG